jgi:predicted helicase
MIMEEVLANILRKLVSQSQLPQFHTHFDVMINEFLAYYDEPVHSVTEMRVKRQTKTKGDLWEQFCKLYLKTVKKYDDVWLLKELPAQLRDELGLGTHDVGIDIVAKKKGKYSAVQCKFKKPRSGHVPGTWIPYNCVNWGELSTFYALCSRTNNNDWHQHIVMTNTKYVRHMGEKTEKDKSYCVGSFRKLTTLDYVAMIPKQVAEQEVKAHSSTPSKLTLEQLREARLKRFESTETTRHT